VEGFCEHGNEPSGSIKCWKVDSGGIKEKLNSNNACYHSVSDIKGGI
jgi:hypothetical protein